MAVTNKYSLPMPVMNFSEFVQKLRVRLTKPLPGMEAQIRMAPPKRLPVEEYLKMKNFNPRKSAVLICFYPRKSSIYTVLMLRPDEMGHHSNQVSFPGGRVEENDQGYDATALREAWEEVGLGPSGIEVIGNLSAVYIPVSNFLVHPVVAVMPLPPEFRINRAEVLEIIETDCTVILDPGIKANAVFKSSGGLRIEAPYYQIKQHKIWGATAMILSELEVIFREIIIEE